MFALIILAFLSSPGNASAATIPYPTGTPSCDWIDQKLNLCVVAEWALTPIIGDENELYITLRDLTTGAAVCPSELTSIEVVPWRNAGDNGHGTTVPIITEYERLGLVVARFVNFTLPGEWDVTITLTKTTPKVGTISKKIVLKTKI